MARRDSTVIRIDGNVGCDIKKSQNGNWIAICEPLKLTFQAETWANLMEDIAFTIDAILRDLLSSNELDKFLRDHGWKLVGSIPRDVEVRFDLPFIPTIMNSSHDSQRQIH